MSSFSQDLRLAFRQLRQKPVTTALIVLSLGLALAGNAVLFSVIEALLLRPFPYPQPDRVALLWAQDRNLPGWLGLRPVSPSAYLELAERSRTFSHLAALRGRSVQLGGTDGPEEISGLAVTPEYFEVLGAGPATGRGFLPSEGVPGAAKVVVLSHELWQSRLAGRPDLVGKTISIDDEAHTVVGILPPGFAALSPGIQLYLALPLDAARAAGDAAGVFVTGRLAAGITLAAARQELTTLGARLEDEQPAAQRGLTLTALSLREQFPGPSDRMLWSILQTVMLMVLAIACLNIANLLLVRGQDRLYEVALRTTLGAKRGDIARQVFAESGLLAAAGGALGLGLAAWAVELGASLLGDRLPQWMEPALNARVGLFTLTLTAGAALLVGLLPALRMAHPNLLARLKESGQGVSSDPGRRRLARTLVIAQVSLSLVLLAATGYLVRGILALSRAEPGFDDTNLTVFRLNLPERRYPGDAELTAFVDRLESELEVVPGIESVAIADSLPRSRTNPSASFEVDGRESGPEVQPPSSTWITVSAGYFAKLGIPLREGRGFEKGDGTSASGTGVAVVSEAWAERFNGGASPLGRHLLVGGKRLEIVGVVGDVLQNRLFLDRGHSPTVYVPLAQSPARNAFFLVRARTEIAGDLGGLLRAHVAELDPSQPVSNLETFAAHVERQYFTERLIASFISVFALFGLLLSALGIYGVVAYTVARQTREIGIRMAVGAQRIEILHLVLRQGLALTGLGLSIGVLPAYLVSRLFTTAFGSFVPTTPQAPTLPIVAFLIGLVTLVASLVPAQRAARLEPVEALRRG